MKKQANKTASSGSSDKESSAESSAPEEGETSSPDPGVNSHSYQVEDAESEMEGNVHALQQLIAFQWSWIL